MRRIILATFLSLWLAPWSTPVAAETAEAVANESLVRELRAGAVVLLRHAQTSPGVGDPPGWRPNVCASQRNLDAGGQAQARRIGQWFSAQGLTVTQVRQSPMCRTRDTARLAFGRGDDWAALDSIFEDRSRAAAQAAAAQEALAAAKPGQLMVWVSHSVTIALIVGEAGNGLAPGEAVVVRWNGQPGMPLRVLGRLRVP
ncbi:MAG: histidine phosphatase family protein [Aquabacterium sp.]